MSTAASPWRLAADCPTCGAPLRLRRNRRDRNQFLGCTRYPRCEFTEDYLEAVGEIVREMDELRVKLWYARRGATTQPRLSPAAEVLEKELRGLIFAWHPDRHQGPLTPNGVVSELTRIRDLVRGAA